MILTFHKIRTWILRHFELLCWVAALVALFFLRTNQSETSLCVFSALGFGKCWGCGIGHSMHYALRGDWISSWQHHPLGIIAVIIIINRIRQLTIQTSKP